MTEDPKGKADDVVSSEDRKILEAYNDKWGCFGLGIPTNPSSVAYWVKQAREGAIPTDVYDVGKDDNDD